MGQTFRLTTLQDNTITTSSGQTNGQITLNGQKMPLEQFLLYVCNAGIKCSGRTRYSAAVIHTKRRRFFSPALFFTSA